MPGDRPRVRRAGDAGSGRARPGDRPAWRLNAAVGRGRRGDGRRGPRGARPRRAPARRARLLVSFGAIRLQAPERPGKAAGTNPPIDCWFVRAWEPEPPEGVEPLEWRLYHDRPVEDL